MPHLGEGCGELLHAFRYPHQRPHGIAQRGGLDQALERREELGVVLAKRTTPATGSANPPLWQRLPIEIVLAAIDRRAGEPGNLRDNRKTASTCAAHLGGRKKPSPSLVKPRADRVPPQTNRGLVDHATELRLFVHDRNPQSLSQSDARQRAPIRLLFDVS